MKKLFPVAACIISLAAHAEVYKWTDAQGRVHYSDQPVEGNRKVETASKVTLHAGKRVQRDPGCRTIQGYSVEPGKSYHSDDPEKQGWARPLEPGKDDPNGVTIFRNCN